MHMNGVNFHGTNCRDWVLKYRAGSNRVIRLLVHVALVLTIAMVTDDTRAAFSQFNCARQVGLDNEWTPY